ncbi:HD domain-containing protein [Patescibacteria group bacterium]|nr:HD domain-containing protein [Patescibacteria group bacterium]
MNKNLIDFFLKTGEVKRMKQRGLVMRGVKDPAVVGGHSFRTAIMAWVIARVDGHGLDTNRLIKLILLHDLVGGYAGDLTPYESLISKTTKKDLKSMYEKWIRIPKKEKEQFARQQHTKEQKALGQLVRLLPKNVAAEMQSLWDEYEQRLTREGRFVHQIHMLENHLQSLEYWRKDKKFPIESWWHEVKELMSEPILVEFAKELDVEFHGHKKERAQK